MAIIRPRHRENPYSMIDRFVFESDPNLTWKAKGMMGYLMTRPDGWTIRHTDLVNRAKDGKDSVSAGLKELEKAGYIHYYQERTATGKFGEWVYDVFERPEFNPTWMGDYPLPGNPVPDYPVPEKPDYSNNNYNNNNFSNKNLNTNTLNTFNDDDDEEAPFEINKYAFVELINNFEEQFPGKFDDPFWDRIYQQMIVQKVSIITFDEGFNQMKYMKGRQDQGEIIGDYAAYFVGGIIRKRTSEASALRQQRLAKAETRKQKPDEQPPVPFYDWREE